MALYRQQSGSQNQLDYTSTRTNTIGSFDHVNNDVCKAQQKQPRYPRRLGHSQQRLLIGSLIIIVCFILAVSTYVFVPRDHSAGTDTSAIKNPQLKFSALSCDLKLLNSTGQLVEPPENKKFARFHLSYTDREENQKGVDHWEPRFAGHQSLQEREYSFLARDQKINCGFINGPKANPSTGFVLSKDDQNYINKCHIAVVSCLFANYDRLKSPFPNVISSLSRDKVCFVMFTDKNTLRNISLEGQVRDRMGFIGIWKVVVVKNFPYTDMQRAQKIPKFLLHRIFPSVRYSIWVDAKLRLERDPLLLLERYLWRKGNEYAISDHYVRHCVWDEAARNKVLNRVNHTLVDQQLQFYQADGLKRFNASDPENLLPSYVPESCVIIREHTPMSNLFSCLWYNEVDRFTYRDQLSFMYTYQKLIKKNPGKPFYLDMFKDCERKQIVTLFKHRHKEKNNTVQNVIDNPWRIFDNLSNNDKDVFYKKFISRKYL